VEEGIDGAPLRGPFLSEENHQAFPDKAFGEEPIHRVSAQQVRVVGDEDLLRNLRVSHTQAHGSPPAIQKVLLPCAPTTATFNSPHPETEFKTSQKFVSILFF
jgi:hypothetical protein